MLIVLRSMANPAVAVGAAIAVTAILVLVISLLYTVMLKLVFKSLTIQHARLSDFLTYHRRIQCL